MPRPTTKQDLLEAATTNFEKLMKMMEELNEQERTTDFDFSNDEKRKEAHWNRDKNLRDVYIHLYEWHQLLLHFIDENMKGNSTPFIPLPYTWKTYGDMNVMFWEKHQSTPLEDSKRNFIQSHHDIIKKAETFSNDELFSKNIYPWVGGSTLGSYFVSVSASHYDWAMKKLKAHKKRCKDL